MIVLSFQNARAGILQGVSLELGPGLHGILGQTQDGTRALVELAIGSFAPQGGQIRVLGAAPHHSPETRKQIASLLAEEPLGGGATVESSLAEPLDPLGFSAKRALEMAGLGGWAKRRPSELANGERRSVALAIALAHPSPKLVAVFEPFVDLPGLPSEWVEQRLRDLAQSGACVLVVSRRDRMIQRSGGSILRLASGRIQETLRAAPPSPGEAGPSTFLVRSALAQELAQALLHREEVTQVVVSSGNPPREIQVTGPDAEALALQLLQLAETHGIPLEAIIPLPNGPRPPAVSVATSGSAS